MVTLHISLRKKRCGLRPLVSPLTGSERLREMSGNRYTLD